MHKAWATKRKMRGFTIIELIVTIVVIGILAGIMIVSYNGIQQRSRDATRDSDVTQLKIALEKYHADQSQYPSVCADNLGCAVSLLSAPLAPYLSKIPHDPSYPVDSTNDYQYVRSATANDAYAILVHYEAKSVCKTGHGVSAGWWGVSVPTC
jgi:type II secretion system protein G